MIKPSTVTILATMESGLANIQHIPTIKGTITRPPEFMTT